jgi:hypothetical protein
MTNWELIRSTFNDNVGPDAPFTDGYGVSIHGFSSAAQTLRNLVIKECEFSRNRGTHATSNISTGLQIVSRVGDHFSGISIEKSIFSGNGRNGMTLEQTDEGTLSNVSVACSNFEQNGEAGINAFDGGATTHVVIKNSNFIGNRIAGISNSNSVEFDARGNWWNSPEGPSNPILNPDGRMDGVTAGVQYRPWRFSSADCAPSISKKFTFRCELKNRENPPASCQVKGAFCTMSSGESEACSAIDSFAVQCKNDFNLYDRNAPKDIQLDRLSIYGNEGLRKAKLEVKPFKRTPGEFQSTLILDLEKPLFGKCKFVQEGL